MSMFNKVTKTFQWGSHRVTMETGEIARQTTAPSVPCSPTASSMKSRWSSTC